MQVSDTISKSSGIRGPSGNLLSVCLLVGLLFPSCEEYNLERTNPLHYKTDLLVKDIQVNPSTVARTNNVSISCTVVNRGYETADFPWDQLDGLYYYISADNRYDAGDIELGTSNLNDIEGGKSTEINGKSLEIPFSAPTGNVYILCFVDKEGDISEGDETNNVSSYMITVN
jgi:hypothetical protein